MELYNIRKKRYSPGVQWEFRVKNAALDRELFQEEFETVTTVYVVNKEYTFAFDKTEFQDYVGEQKFVNFGASSAVI